MANDPLNHANFGLLPEQKGRFGSFGISMIVNVALAALILLLTMAGVHQAKLQKENTALLVFPAEPKPVPPPPVPKVRVIPPPPKVEPKIAIPKPVVEPPKPVEIKLPTPPAPHLAPAPPLRVTPPPQPKVGLFASTHPTAVANNNQHPSPHTGGFGDPVGVTPNPNATRPATIAAAGSFAGTPGIGEGAGAARKGSVHGVDFGSGVANGVKGGKDTRGTVASAGFANGVIGGTGRPGGSGRVAQAGFSNTGQGSAPPPARRVEEVHSTPLVVLSKPAPGYTAEARQLRIEGDVTLQVRFTAAGHVEVLRVVSGLGHGLDQLATAAAERIQFKPATRDGQPVDEVTVIRMTFQLA
jgi:TonB family protein